MIHSKLNYLLHSLQIGEFLNHFLKAKISSLSEVLKILTKNFSQEAQRFWISHFQFTRPSQAFQKNIFVSVINFRKRIIVKSVQNSTYWYRWVLVRWQSHVLNLSRQTDFSWSTIRIPTQEWRMLEILGSCSPTGMTMRVNGPRMNLKGASKSCSPRRVKLCPLLPNKHKKV